MILSIETATKVCSVAIHNQGTLVAVAELHMANSHSEHLSMLIKNLLERSEVKRENLTAIAVSAGPGSYTGLRIGTSTAKGLCFALDIPLIAVDTLEALALTFAKYTKNTLLCPMIDARRMEVYCQIRDNALGVIQETEAKIIDEDSFSELLDSQKIAFFGNGSEKCREVITHINATFIQDVTPSATSIGELAWSAFEKQEFEDLAYFEPHYLKEFQAIKPKKLIV